MAKSYKRRGSKKNRSMKRKQMGGNVAANAAPLFDNTSSRLISMIGADAATQLTHAPTGQFNLKGGNVARGAEAVPAAQGNYLLTQQGGKKKNKKNNKKLI